MHAEPLYPKSGDESGDSLRGRAAAGVRLVQAGIVLNIVLAALKFAGGIYGHTYALIADGVESLLDVVTSLFVWFGLRLAATPPDEDHPYGHGKAETLAGFAVSLAMFGAAGFVSWRAVGEIRTPHLPPHWATLPLLAGVIAVKAFFSRRLVRASRHAGSSSLGVEAWHHLADALTSSAAFIGIAIAVWGGPAYATADDWAAIAASIVIAWNGVALARRSIDDIMDVAVPDVVEKRIRQVASTVPGVAGIEKCRVRRSGLSHLLDIHVEVDGRLTVIESHKIAGAVKHALLRSDLQVSDVLVHIEPAPGQ